MTIEQTIPQLALFPITTEVNEKGHLVLGGCDSVALAEEFGTPLYVFDEADIRQRCSMFKEEFGQRYPDVAVIYACKAFTNKAMLVLIKEEGLGLDVVSGGELSVAHSVDFPMNKVCFAGNNKSAEELELALKLGIWHIVVDNLHELTMLREIAGERKADILLRLTPGVDPHTHQYNTTGTIDSKFGFTMSTWEEAVATAMEAPNLNPVGIHIHIGSGIFEVEPYQKSIEVVLEFAADMRQKYNFEIKELDIGGGYGIQYTIDEEPPPISYWAECLSKTIIDKCHELELPLPKLIIEPGRSTVGRAGVAFYRACVIKDIPGVRRSLRRPRREVCCGDRDPS